MAQQQLQAVVAGGSLGGLVAGLELASVGCDVQIFERSGHVLDDRGAGIVMQAETMHILRKYQLADEQTAGVWSNYRQYLNQDGSPLNRQPSRQLMTSWGLLYRHFRSAFPAANYHEGQAVESFSQDGSGVELQIAGSAPRRADLLVCADGARSTCRGLLAPDVAPRYAGYVAWRGVVPEASISEDLLSHFIDHFTFYQMHKSHILCYLIPGVAGELTPGERRLNWVWYWNVPEAELHALMTDVDGRQRDFSVPPKQVRPEYIDAQRLNAERHLPRPFLELFNATAEPFIQPILDLAVSRMAYGRVCLVGDAAFVPRPHTAASTSKAAGNGIALAEAVSRNIDVVSALQSWEPAQLAIGRELEAHGRLLGNRSQFPELSLSR